MANVVDILINGTDLSASAFAKASANTKQLTAQTTQLGTQTKALGGIFSATGNVAAALGATHFTNLANGAQMIAMGAAQAAQSFRAMNSALKASLVGLLAIGAAYGINKLIQYKEEVKLAAEATKKLGEIARETEARNIALANPNKGRIKDEEIRHRRALEQIQELTDAKADAATVTAALEQEEMRHNAEMFRIRKESWKEATDFRAHLNQEEKDGQVQTFIELMQAEGAMQMEQLDSRREFISAYKDFWMESHRSMFSYVAEGSRTVSHGLSNALVDVAMRTKSAAEAFKELGLSIVRMFAQWIVNRSIAFVAEKVLAAVGIGLAKAQAAAVSGIAAGVAAAWAPAATASLIATYGSSASAAALLVPAMAANQAAAVGLSLTGGQAHGGLDRVPREGTYLLDGGEAVVQPKQNVRLSSMLDDWEAGSGAAAGGRMMHVTVYVGDRAIIDTVNQASHDGRLMIKAKSVKG